MVYGLLLLRRGMSCFGPYHPRDRGDARNTTKEKRKNKKQKARAVDLLVYSELLRANPRREHLLGKWLRSLTSSPSPIGAQKVVDAMLIHRSYQRS